MKTKDMPRTDRRVVYVLAAAMFLHLAHALAGTFHVLPGPLQAAYDHHAQRDWEMSR